MATYESSHYSNLQRLSPIGILVALGIVFGDIGTSPLYVMKAITGVNPTYDPDYIIGAVSCVIWTLTLQTTIKYVLIALSANNKGEGGILALFALLRKHHRKWLYTIAAIGAAALIADGVITPAITVTSAIEGLSTISPDIPVVPIVIIIIIAIFIFQQAGTGKIGQYFGPFMLLWFLMLGILGACLIGSCPAILKAFNPWYAFRLLVNYPGWFLVLGAVFLCTTGAEALYSDLGHCGRKNISVSWIFVKTMLILNYLGQGAWLVSQTGTPLNGINPFYAIMPHSFMIIGVVMSTGAAIIASQALLSGSFTIFSEAINLGLWPCLKIKYPSGEKGQLYIPAVNWSLLAGCIVTIIIFRDSSHMEAAYGLAITVTMLMTTILLTLWLRSKGMTRAVCLMFFTFFVTLESIFFAANMFKFAQGGWFTILIAGLVAAIMIIWFNSIKVRARFIEYRPLREYTELICSIKKDKEIPKFASNLIYFSRSPQPDLIESKIVYSIINKQPKRADHYFIIRFISDDAPDTLEYDVNIVVPDTIYIVTMHFGFRINPLVSVYLRQVVEDLVADNKLDLTSTYPSLKAKNIPGDFRFIIIHRTFSMSSTCHRKVAMLMQLHDMLRHLGITNQSALSLDTSVVTLETVPLIINTTTPRRISPTTT